MAPPRNGSVMSDAWQRVVLDDAEPEQRLDAITLSELRQQSIDEFRDTMPQQIVDALAGVTLTTPQLQALIARIVDVSMTAMHANIEKIEIRLRGGQPVH
jgi:hypothetical protein